MPNPLAKPRLNAFHNQSGLCYYCDKPIWLDDVKSFASRHGLSAPAALRFKCTAEHLTARCDGGGNNKSNIVAACWFCNSKRHKRKKPPAPQQYKALVQRRLKKGKWHPKVLQHLVSRTV